MFSVHSVITFDPNSALNQTETAVVQQQTVHQSDVKQKNTQTMSTPKSFTQDMFAPVLPSLNCSMDSNIAVEPKNSSVATEQVNVMGRHRNPFPSVPPSPKSYTQDTRKR